MGKKRGKQQGKGEEIKVDFGGNTGAGNAKYEPQPKSAREEQKKPLEKKNSSGGQGFYGGGGSSGGMMQQFSQLQPEAAKSDYEPVDFMAENSTSNRQVKQVNQPQSQGRGKRQNYHDEFEVKQFETPEPMQQNQGGGGRGRGRGRGQRPQQLPYNPYEESKGQRGNHNQGQDHSYGGYKYKDTPQQMQSYGQPKKQANNYNREYYNHQKQNDPDLPNMGQSKQSKQGNEQKKIREKVKVELPPLKEDVKAEILESYENYDLESLLQMLQNNKAEINQDGTFTLEQSQLQTLGLMEQLQDVFSKSSETPLPEIQAEFGNEAIQPLQPPLTFSLDEDRRNFEMQIAPWRLSKDTLLSQLLLRNTVEQVNSKTLDPLFTFDVEELKQQAACNEIKNSKDVQAEVRQRVNTMLDDIHGKLTKSTNVELGQQIMEVTANRDCASGQVTAYTFSEPKEQFEMEADFEGNAKEILLSNKLNDENEIDQILAEAADPFDDVSEDEDDEEANKKVSHKFLVELRDMELQQKEDQALKEKQMAEQSRLADEALKAQQKLMEEQSNEGMDESDEESKLQPNSSEGQQIQEEKKEVLQKNEATSIPQEKDQIDEILGSSNDYQTAVDQSRLFSSSSQKMQAEPSHFHLAAVANERKNPTITAQNAGLPIQDQSWVIADNIKMDNFKELVQDPAIEYPFELDDFQKRAVYRLEQGNCVMVAAHTSAGKTLVAEYAIALSRRHMTKTIYTSPIKSLSNQKYRDFKLKFGDVGVLTGDVQLNKDASCMIMTTEVLQAMLYNSSSYLQDVEWVIFDEVHYITDEERGSVWEEVIIKLPDTVSIVMLSATVPNYLEFATWVGRVKQKKIYVQYTQQRPVPLCHNAIIDGKIITVKHQDKNTDMNTLKKCFAQRGQLRAKQQINKGGGGKEDKAEEKQKAQEKEERAKKIDFKAKALKAKENSVKKVVSKAMKGQGQNAGGKGGGQTGGKKKSDAFQKTLEAITRENLLPCIVFVFKRSGTIQYAEELDPTTDFTDGYTKGLIKKFIKQKLQRLDEVDRDLPQIQTVTKLLVRGIGVHHAGLLQLLKELVEILFSDGYLKVVFATSTFAIGLNLPARSVVFTELQKFDGQDMATISTSEYLQMAGRAGRRGKDQIGYSLLCMDPGIGKVPHSDDLSTLLDSKGIALESKLKVDYSTCLNSLKQDQEGFGAMLENSFFANETATVKIQAQKKKKRIEPLYERSKEIDCVYGVPEQAYQFYKLVGDLWDLNDKLSFQQPTALSVVEVVTAKHIFKQMIVLKPGTTRSLMLFINKEGNSLPIAYEENKVSTFESAKKTNRYHQVHVQGNDGQHAIYAYEIVDIWNVMITQAYANRITQIAPQQLKFVDKHQLIDKQVKLIAKEFNSVRQHLQLESLKVSAKRKKFNEIINQREQVIDQLRSTKCFDCEQVSYHMSQLEVFERYQKQMEEIDKILTGNVDEKEKDFENRNVILSHYKIIDSDYNLLFKGKVAAQVTAVDKILLTEFFFSGLIGELSDQELLSLLSVFVTRERAPGGIPDCGKQYSDKFTDALNFIMSTTEKLIDLEQKFGVIEEQQTLKRINLKFYELVYDWADQKTFADCVVDSGIDEGAVVKMILAVNRVRVCIENMASVVGDNALASRLKELDPLTNRGIVKMQSLYLEVEQEPPRLKEQDEDILVKIPSSPLEEESKVQRKGSSRDEDL